MSYDFRAAEAKWQARWNAKPPARFDLIDIDPERAFYNLVEFPYPSAEGLHVGHVYTYCGADSLGRYLTMNGHQVFQPMGWDSFGIHTENYALKIDQDPHVVTDRATANYRRQLERVGANWSWESELRTDDPSYYRWTQWIFLQLYRAGLAVRKESSVVWCPSCLTVLAFEQVEGGRCERCSTVVASKTMRQWYLRITAYADELLDTLEDLDWPQLSKQLQREWIGRSPGADVAFRIVGDQKRSLTAFTTRVDTLFGVTYVAIAPEHELADEFAARSTNEHEILRYVTKVRQRVGADRLSSVGSEAVGVATDVRVIHPLTGAEIPVLVADYVLADYGTGVVMGVPAHDRRDMNFAATLNLPIKQVIVAAGAVHRSASAEVDLLEVDGVLIDSDRFTGMTSAQARVAIASQLADAGQGGSRTQYRLHDWLVSRQRYWGSPIPIIYCQKCGEIPVPEEDLPVVLPKTENIRPTGSGMSPLAAVESFVRTTCPTCGGPAERETDVFDTFVESSWYFLRYPSHDVANAPWDPAQTRRMLPVDMYAGGREHATRHHLYARFVTRALHDLGLLDFPEPFTKLRLHGLIIKDGAKMSKSRGNVINPDEYIDRFGSDNLRAYLLFCGPWEEGGDFNDRSLNGIVRFNDRLTSQMEQGPSSGQGGVDMGRLDRAIHKVGKDIEALKFNTAIAELMSLSNWFRDAYAGMNVEEWDRTRRTFALLLAPLEPFLAEELWEQLGEGESVHRQWWPSYDPQALVATTVNIPVQVDGKLRTTVTVARDADQEAVVVLAMAQPAVADVLNGGAARKVIYVPGRILSLVS